MVCSRQTRGAADALRRQLVHRAQRRALGRLRRQEPAQGVLSSQSPAARADNTCSLNKLYMLYRTLARIQQTMIYATYLLIRFL